MDEPHKFATGGVVRGPGSGTDDSVSAQLSGGCWYGVPITESQRAVLEAANAGVKIPGFAAGGLIVNDL